MLQKRKNPLIKKPLKRFNWQNIKYLKQSNIQTIISGIVGIVFIGILALSLMKFNNEQANAVIQNNITNYFSALSSRNFVEAQTFYANADSENTKMYINELSEKARGIKLQSITPDTIYPALVNGNLGVVGVKVTTKGQVQNQNVEATELTLFIMLKEQDKWKITQPSDLSNYSEDHITKLLDEYKKVLEQYPEINELTDINNQQFKEYKQAIAEAKKGKQNYEN